MTHAGKVFAAGSIATAVAVALLGGSGQPPARLSAQTQNCIGGMGTPEQRPRRADAVQLARSINTAESRAASSTKRYQPLQNLSTVTLPAGYAVQLVTSDTGYVFTVKDSQDACGFGLFSDQNGVIYLAETLK